MRLKVRFSFCIGESFAISVSHPVIKNIEYTFCKVKSDFFTSWEDHIRLQDWKKFLKISFQYFISHSFSFHTKFFTKSFQFVILSVTPFASKFLSKVRELLDCKILVEII
jgi:hypothetical protein